MANTRRRRYYAQVMDEGRKRVIGIMAAILAAMHMRTADDLFGTPQGSPRTDKLIAASIQWAETIMEKIDNMHPEGVLKIGAGSLMYAPDATQSRCDGRMVSFIHASSRSDHRSY